MISKYYILVFACMLYLAQGSLLEELAEVNFNGDDPCCRNARKLGEAMRKIGKIYMMKGDKSKIPGLKANMTRAERVVEAKCPKEVGLCFKQLRRFQVVAQWYEKSKQKKNYNWILNALKRLSKEGVKVERLCKKAEKMMEHEEHQIEHDVKKAVEGK